MQLGRCRCGDQAGRALFLDDRSLDGAVLGLKRDGVFQPPFRQQGSDGIGKWIGLCSRLVVTETGGLIEYEVAVAKAFLRGRRGTSRSRK